MRAWLHAEGLSHSAMTRLMREFASEYDLAGVRTFQKTQLNHILMGRRNPTLTQAIALWHMCGIEPGEWLREA